MVRRDILVRTYNYKQSYTRGSRHKSLRSPVFVLYVASVHKLLRFTHTFCTLLLDLVAGFPVSG